MEIPALSISGLTKLYQGAKGDSITALDNVNLIIPRGTCCALLGPNGAGKSTMIGVLAGTVTKTFGSVSIMGHDIDRDSRAAKRIIGVVPQNLAADVYFPIRQSLKMYAGYYGINASDDYIDQLLKDLGLYSKRDVTVRQLSGGMFRRLLVAKALVHKPQVVVLDEPTAGVDLALRDHLWEYLTQLNNAGVTVIITTHYLQEAEKLCSLFVFINNGKILASRTKGEVEVQFAHKLIKLNLAEPISEVPDYLQKYSPILESGLTLTLKCMPELLGSLISDLHSSKLAISDMEISQADLETLFRSLILGDQSA